MQGLSGAVGKCLERCSICTRIWKGEPGALKTQEASILRKPSMPPPPPPPPRAGPPTATSLALGPPSRAPLTSHPASVPAQCFPRILPSLSLEEGRSALFPPYERFPIKGKRQLWSRDGGLSPLVWEAAGPGDSVGKLRVGPVRDTLLAGRQVPLPWPALAGPRDGQGTW